MFKKTRHLMTFKYFRVVFISAPFKNLNDVCMYFFIRGVLTCQASTATTCSLVGLGCSTSTITGGYLLSTGLPPAQLGVLAAATSLRIVTGSGCLGQVCAKESKLVIVINRLPL